MNMGEFANGVITMITGDEFERMVMRIAQLEAALRKIADGDPKQVYSPLGPMHAAGIVCQWKIDAKIAREALQSETASKPQGELTQCDGEDSYEV
jgi:hypothetical protein